ncbi:hypothetical protein niasHS_000442 [Heterodera schachtii]|uniref:Integrase catalytic domain-containing protein n=1 Tax=Heterodera schachtii TaxID=97005 RepID=A0ABD2K6X8_HETSC
MYNDPSSPAAFAGVTALWKEARKKIKHLRKDEVQTYLDGHRTYTLMRPRRVHFPRAKTIAAGFMTDVQVDLADFQALSRHNGGHRYLLVAIDVLSKRLFVVPLKNKRAEEMLDAFKELIEQMPMVPHRIFSDKGTEFKNRLVKEFFEEQEIEKHEPVHSSVKASVAERAIRNVKQRLYRYFAEKQTLNWVDTVQQIVDGINSAPSRVHGMRPIDVNFQNAQKVWKRMYGQQIAKISQRRAPRFRKNEFVRMSREKRQFEKGYLPNYGDEILEVDQVLKAVRPIRYKLRDDHGEKFRGTFYEQELARVRKDDETSYRIEKVLKKRRKSDGSIEMLWVMGVWTAQYQLSLLRNFGLSQTLITDDPAVFAEYLDNRSLDVTAIDQLDDEHMLISYEKKKEWVEEHACSNIVISLWTTSAARLLLLRAMQKVVRTPGCVLLYTDTDSLIFAHPIGLCPLQTGPHLGQFTDEYPKHEILEFCSGGAKQYGLKLRRKDAPADADNEYVLKVRGMTLNYDVIQNQGLRYETFKDKVLRYAETGEPQPINVMYPNFLRPSIKDGRVISCPLQKIYKPFVGKGIVGADFQLLDFGHTL